jgi:hypothetical protein
MILAVLFEQIQYTCEIIQCVWDSESKHWKLWNSSKHGHTLKETEDKKQAQLSTKAAVLLQYQHELPPRYKKLFPSLLKLQAKQTWNLQMKQSQSPHLAHTAHTFRSDIIRHALPSFLSVLSDQILKVLGFVRLFLNRVLVNTHDSLPMEDTNKSRKTSMMKTLTALKASASATAALLAPDDDPMAMTAVRR